MHNQNKEAGTTKATLTEGNITLNKDSSPTATTAKALRINTNLTEANKPIAQPKDVNQILKEQHTISQNVGHIAAAAKTFSGNQAKEAEAEAKKAEEAGDLVSAEAKRKEAESWQTGGSNKRKVDAITNAISLALSGQSPQGIAAGAASPYVNQAIKDITKDIPELNIPAHILWGAIEAELAGGKATTGAIAAGVGEAAAPIITKALFGNKKPNELTEAEKQQVLNLSKLAAGVASGLTATGNSAENLATISQGMKIAENAVEHNALSLKDVYVYQRALKKAIENGESTENVHKKFQELSEKQRSELLINCDVDCRATVPKELLSAVGFADELSGVLNSWVQGLPLDEQTKFYQLVEIENAKTIQLLKDKQSGLEKGIELAIDAAQFFSKETNLSDKSVNFTNKTKNREVSAPVFSTDGEAYKVAKELGYIKTNYRTKSGAAVFRKGNSYITRDVDGHNGGAWKEASSPEKLNKKETRNGTFDINLNKIGD